MKRVEHGPRGWEVAVTDGPAVTASALVDASGRNGRLARALNAERLVFDHLVGVGRRWREAPKGDNHVLVEATADGWWYSAPIPGGGLITLLMTDADICRDGRLTDANRWDQALRATQLTGSRVGDAVPVGRIRSHAAGSARTIRRDDDRPWLAVGDAALAVDPLTGGGVVRALRTAAGAAAAVAELLAGTPKRWASAIHDYEHDRNLECSKYLRERLAYYQAGPLVDSLFWSRRREVAERALGRTSG